MNDKLKAEAERRAQQPLAGGDWTVPGLGLEFVHVPPGSFRMGSDEAEDEKPVHDVEITRPFWLAKYPVTQAEYEALMETNPSYFQDEVVLKPGFLGFGRKVEKRSRPKWPVERVSWDDAVEFCRKLTERERLVGRLPDGYAYCLSAEAEWEYAARGGVQSRGFTYAGSNCVDEVAWYGDNSGVKIHPVGQKKPNELGLYDMTGNLWEWCQDWYGDYPSGGATDPSGPTTGSSHVYRGGGWCDDAGRCRSAIRDWDDPLRTDFCLGFRVALAPVR